MLQFELRPEPRIQRTGEYFVRVAVFGKFLSDNIAVGVAHMGGHAGLNVRAEVAPNLDIAAHLVIDVCVHSSQIWVVVARAHRQMYVWQPTVLKLDDVHVVHHPSVPLLQALKQLFQLLFEYTASGSWGRWVPWLAQVFELRPVWVHR